MARKKTTKKKSVKKKTPIIVVNPLKTHVKLLYVFMIFTWALMFSMFIESMGGFVINLRATLFGFVIGIGATALIFYR